MILMSVYLGHHVVVTNANQPVVVFQICQTDALVRHLINVVLTHVLLKYVYLLVLFQDATVKKQLIVIPEYAQIIYAFQIVGELPAQVQTAIAIYLLTVLLLLVPQILANQRVEESYC